MNKTFRPVIRSQLGYDPRVALRRITVPVAALHGEFDAFVPTDQNVPEIERALKESPQPRHVVRVFAGLSHSFRKTAKPRDPDADETISSEVLECVVSWIKGNDTKRDIQGHQ